MQKFLPIKKSIFIVCLAMMLCWIPVTAHAAGHREAPTSPTRILFVGNSYTQRNHMPNIFRKLCKSSGQNVIVRSLTNPGRSLKNTSNPTTANGRKLYRLLRMQRWDYVILQDRRYYPISKPQRMKRTIRKLAPYIQASGAKMVLYQTWAPGKWHNDYNRYDSVSNRSDYQSILNRTIAEIAEEHNALVAPVGTAFLLCSHSSYGIKLLMDKTTQKEVMIDGKPVTAETEFTPKDSNGSVEVIFTFDGSTLAGHDVVVFEKLFSLEGETALEIASHEDLDDKGQTIKLTEAPKDTPEPSKPVKTGDETTVLPYLLLAGAALLFAAGFGILYIRKRKKDK